MILALPLMAYTQPADKAPILLRDRKGIIRAMEITENDAASSLSDLAFMKQYLLVTAEDVFVKARDKQRRAGFINDHFDQFYKDVKVDGAGYNFHYKGGKMYYTHGHYVKLRNFDVVPAITP
ncbi:hypothetical protein FAES_4363 [Fibrella aestuarina BUZ 2]|uniref:Uncharacterized protein n=1 Tax=Fibrella aestuarina BUZ 2 TaxID=1166018 RepID=I0KE09_9BACT|nr:hypothetical protein [Fibrella aestuarina]CCH02362.1 hypothetical protein FAES_4363 [Fibrella aestuarina BUZ 2]